VKIALIHPTAPPVEGEIERLLARQIHLLRQSGHCVSLATYEGGHGCGADCLVPLSREASRKALTLYLEAALAGTDAVIFHNLGTMPLAPELTAALRELPRRLPAARWICWVHDMACRDPLFLPFGNAEVAYWMSTPCADWEYVAANALCAAQLQHDFGIQPTLLSSGVDCSASLGLSPEIDRLAQRVRLWNADLILLHPVPIQPHRGIETSLRLLAMLRNQSIRAFLIVGSGEPEVSPAGSAGYSDALRVLRSAAGLTDCCLLEGEDFAPNRQTLTQWKQIADAVLLPGPTPNRERWLWEAALAGIPAFYPETVGIEKHPASFCYPANLSEEELARWLIRQMAERDAIQARRLARGQHPWPDAYEKSLASFLEKPHNWNPT
jgi:hypothetical protein